MSLGGKIVNGVFNVVAGGHPIARKTDLTDHGGKLAEGCETVVAGGAAMAVTRVADRFLCPSQVGGKPHVGGCLLLGMGTVLVGGRPVARERDPTLCLAGDAGAQFDGLGGGSSGLADAAKKAACQALWAKYDKEAADILAPVDHDHRERNKVITGAYADLYLKDHDLVWAGLAAYASKQVGCAMDHSLNMAGRGPHPLAGAPVVKDAAEHTYEMLGRGNRELFLNIYPMHRFFQEHGWARMKECAAERVPPISAAALDGFAALDRYKKTGNRRDLVEHLRAIAFHEQVEVLQGGIYNDARLREILDMNEGVPPEDLVLSGRMKDLVDMRSLGALPADVIMTDSCTDPGGHKTLKFGTGDREHVYDVDQRMDWILNEVAAYYLDNLGSQEQQDHLETLRSQGRSAGGGYP